MGTCLSGVSREPGYLPPHDTLSHTKARILILERSSDRYYRRAYREYIDDYGIDDFADAETILETTPPGLQPILRGDVYDKRYMVTKSFTAITAHMSLWIGVDLSTYTTRTHPTCEHVLLKFARAELHRSREFRTELDLQAVVARALRSAWIPQTYSPVHRIMRCFKLNGSGGMHICLVGERMRCDLQTMLAKPERMPINSVRLIGRDLLRALDLLHRDCQLVHTDVRPGAVFVAGQPEALIRGRNRDVFDCEPCAQAGFEFPLPVVKLGHLGRATHIRWPAVLVPVGLLPYRSPEVLLGLHYGPSLDIWSLACTLFETATGAKLFDPDPFTGLGLTESQALLASITQVAGPIHSSMEAVPFARLYFEAVRGIPPEYDLQSVDEASRISRRLERLSGMDHEDAIRMEDFLKLMLDMDPVHRVEARELLRHPWLESVMEVNF